MFSDFGVAFNFCLFRFWICLFLVFEVGLVVCCYLANFSD